MRVQQQRKKAILCYLLIAILLIQGLPIQVRAEGENRKEQALAWLQKQSTEKQEWEDNGLPNLTCNVLALLRHEGMETESTFLVDWQTTKAAYNVDELAHLAWANADTDLLTQLWLYQNADGGFGLTGDYTSDVYDTLLVLQAELAVRDGSQSYNQQETQTAGETDEQATPIFTETQLQAVKYLIAQQRPDGGYGYTKQSETDVALTAEIGITLHKLGVEADEFYTRLDTYCLEQFQKDFSQQNFIEQAKLARYLYLREKIVNPKEVKEALTSIPSEDGSAYSDVVATIQYVLLFEDIEEYERLKLSVTGLVTEANTYVLETGEEQEVSLQTRITYQTNQEVSGLVRYTLLENEIEIGKQEIESMLQPESTETIATTTLCVTVQAENTYQLKVEWISVNADGEEVVWATEIIDFSVHEKQEKEFLLQAQTKTGNDYGVDLSWTDISDEDNRYGYRVFRKKDGNDWETRSTWDGEEKVKVLNIYPCNAAKNYLVEWMEETISDTEEPAGKGLFEIDTVHIDSYNQTPEAYLLDEAENYKYDVLVFGSHDSNAFKDLTVKSYEATQKFVDAGKGVLFGHDTVSNYCGLSHYNFCRFEEQLGIKNKYVRDCRISSQVKVVNSGFLTSYPWKLTGVLNIPPAHTYGQFSGGTLPAIKWMEFQCGYDTDVETGATNNGYLVSRNSLAMIQTGHSNGQATDDERKILANTLFYLKQLTNETTASDKSFYDETAPEITSISEVNENNQVVIEATDYGTTYQYYVEAVNNNHEGENPTSNIVEAEALSEVKGYIIGVSDTEDTMSDLLQYDETGNLISEMIEATDGKGAYTIHSLEPGQSAYVHIYAVDFAGNVSEERVQMITVPKTEKEYLNIPYALFATEQVELYCSEAKIKGDIYGKDTIQFQGSTLLLDGKAATTGTLSLAGGWMELAEKEEGMEAVTLPDYTERIRADMEACEPLEELAVYNSTEITVPTICESTTGAWCQDVKIGASLLSKDSIRLNANNISCGTEEKVVLCSETGDISIQTTTFSGNGLICAPNGTVTINVCDFHYTGTIIAKRIKLQMTTCHINQE